MGTPKGKRYLATVAIDSQFSRRFGVPTGGWENYLYPSAFVARPRQVGPPVFQEKACGGEGSAHANGQARTGGHSISQVGAAGNPASRAGAYGERGRLTIGVLSVMIELNMKTPTTAL